MTRAPRIALPLCLVVFGMAAVPAQATLLVRSDANGLLIEDKNGLNDKIDVDSFGQPRFFVRNNNFTDVFHFDFRAGCQEDSHRLARCVRTASKMNVALSSGDDFLDLIDAPEGDASVSAGSGKDFVSGHRARDNLNGGTGDDHLSGLKGNDFLSGDEGDDRLLGGSGSDDVDGDAGNDDLDGFIGEDVFHGDSGSDSIDSREDPGNASERDSVNCGSGHDYVEADLKDFVASSCEEKDIAPVGETPPVRIGRGTLRVSSTGRVRVRLRCPRGVGDLGCKGRLSLRLDRRGAPRSRKRYEIGAGGRKTITLRLSRGSVRSLRRRQRRGRRTRGIVASSEAGRIGRKTTVRNPRLRLR